MNIFSIAFVTTVLIIGENNINGQTLKYEPNGITWTDATAQCVNGMEYNPDVLGSIKELNGSTLWIGKRVYQKLLPWIEILGCYHVQEVVESYMFQSVGGCQQKCSTTPFFGFKELNGECRCINEKGRLSVLSDCTDMNIRNHMLIYQKYDKLSTQESRHFNTLCMTSSCDYTKKIYLRPTDCKVKDGNINGICVYNDTIGTEKWGATKPKIMEICRREQSLLLPSWKCNQISIQTWSNVFRVLVELELPAVRANGLAPSVSNSCISAYMTNRLVNERRSCSDGLNFFVCRPDSILSTTEYYTTINRLQSSSSRLQFDFKEFSTIDTYTTEMLENNSLQMTTMTKHVEAVEKSQSLEIILGSVFGITAFSTALVAVLIICRKRRLGFFRYKKESTVQYTEQDSPVYCNNQDHQINIRDPKDDNASSYANLTLAEVKIENKRTAVNNVKTTEPISKDPKYGVYDILKPKVNEHVYDSTNIANSSGQTDIYD